MSSQICSSVQAQVLRIQTTLQKFGTNEAEPGMNSDNCKNEPTFWVNQKTSNCTCVQETRQCKYCASCKNSCRKLGMNLRIFPTGSCSQVCSTTPPTGKGQAGKPKWPSVQHDSDLPLSVSVVHDRKRPGHGMKSDHLTSFQTEDWDELALNMVSEFVIRTHPVFTCANILQYGVLVKKKKGGGIGTHFKNEPENHH